MYRQARQDLASARCAAVFKSALVPCAGTQGNGRFLALTFDTLHVGVDRMQIVIEPGVVFIAKLEDFLDNRVLYAFILPSTALVSRA